MRVDTETLHQLIQFALGGGLVTTVASIIKVVRWIRSGVSLRESKRRIDIVQQKDENARAAYDAEERAMRASLQRDGLQLRAGVLEDDLHNAERYIAALTDQLREHGIAIPSRETYY